MDAGGCWFESLRHRHFRFKCFPKEGLIRARALRPALPRLRGRSTAPSGLDWRRATRRSSNPANAHRAIQRAGQPLAAAN